MIVSDDDERTRIAWMADEPEYRSAAEQEAQKRKEAE
jgi:hypothetical protein